MWPGVLTDPCNLGLRQGDHHKADARLGYVVSAGPAWATKSHPVSTSKHTYIHNYIFTLCYVILLQALLIYWESWNSSLTPRNIAVLCSTYSRNIESIKHRFSVSSFPSIALFFVCFSSLSKQAWYLSQSIKCGMGHVLDTAFFCPGITVLWWVFSGIWNQQVPIFSLYQG